jgi:hypothetical protein
MQIKVSLFCRSTHVFNLRLCPEVHLEKSYGAVYSERVKYPKEPIREKRKNYRRNGSGAERYRVLEKCASAGWPMLYTGLRYDRVAHSRIL